MRGGVAAACVALCLGAADAALPASAQAYQQIYCRTYVPAQAECPSAGNHSWYFNSAATDSGQAVCVYMRNNNNGNVRGGTMPCNYGYVDQTFNRTNDPWYNAKVVNGVIANFTMYIVGNAIA